MGSPKGIAKAALILASEDATYSVGAEFLVDVLAEV